MFRREFPKFLTLIIQRVFMVLVGRTTQPDTIRYHFAIIQNDHSDPEIIIQLRERAVMESIRGHLFPTGTYFRRALFPTGTAYVRTCVSAAGIP